MAREFTAIVFGENMRPTKFRSVTTPANLAKWVKRNFESKKPTAINLYDKYSGGFVVQIKL